MPGRRSGVHARQAVVAQPPGEHLGVQGDEGPHEGAPVADGHHLRDERMASQSVLQHGRGDVLPARGDDELFLAACDRGEPVLVDRPDVPRVEPAVAVHGVRRGLRIVAVPPEDVRALEEDLSVLGDLHRAGGDRLADRPHDDPARPVGGRRAGRLRQPVGFDHRQADAAVEVAEALAQRGARRYGEAAVGPEGLGEPVPHEAAGDFPLEAEDGAVEGLARVVDGHSGGPSEGLQAHAPGLRLCGVVDLLQDPGDAQQGGRGEGLDVGQEVAHVRHVSDPPSPGDRVDEDDARHDVGQGQEEEDPGVGRVDDLALGDEDVERGGHEVSVGQLHPLRIAGRARGVDDRHEVVARQGLLAFEDLRLGHVRPRGVEPGHAVGVVDDARQQSGGADALDEAGVRGGVGQDQADRGIGEDPADLFGGGTLVDGDDDSARILHGHVQQAPLVGGRAEDGDGLPRLQPHPDQAARRADDVLLELSGAHLDPGRAQLRPSLDAHVVGRARSAARQQPRDGHGLLDGGCGFVGPGSVAMPLHVSSRRSRAVYVKGNPRGRGWTDDRLGAKSLVGRRAGCVPGMRGQVGWHP